jgi:hypothetical protein
MFMLHSMKICKLFQNVIKRGADMIMMKPEAYPSL